MLFAAAEYNVYLYDIKQSQLDDALEFVRYSSMKIIINDAVFHLMFCYICRNLKQRTI